MSENQELLIHSIIKLLSDSRTSTVLLNLATPARPSVWKLPDDLWRPTVSSHTASSRRPATSSRATAATHRLDLCPSAWRSCLCASRASTRPRASSSRRKPSCKWPEVSREHKDKQTNALITLQRKKNGSYLLHHRGHKQGFDVVTRQQRLFRCSDLRVKGSSALSPPDVAKSVRAISTPLISVLSPGGKKRWMIILICLTGNSNRKHRGNFLFGRSKLQKCK